MQRRTCTSILIVDRCQRDLVRLLDEPARNLNALPRPYRPAIRKSQRRTARVVQPVANVAMQEAGPLRKPAGVEMRLQPAEIGHGLKQAEHGFGLCAQAEPLRKNSQIPSHANSCWPGGVMSKTLPIEQHPIGDRPRQRLRSSGNDPARSPFPAPQPAPPCRPRKPPAHRRGSPCSRPASSPGRGCVSEPGPRPVGAAGRSPQA